MADFKPLWGKVSTDEGFEAMDLGRGGDGFRPMSEWPNRKPERAGLPELSGDFDASIFDDDSADADFVDDTPPDPAVISQRLSGEFSAAAEPDDVALLRAREEAFEIGKQEGLEAGRVEVTRQLEQAAQLVEQLQAARQQLFHRSIEDLATAVMYIAEEIVGRELSVDSEGVESLVTSILADVRSDDEVVVRVAEEDSRFMREAYPALLDMIGRDGIVRLEIDRGLRPGGAIVETSHGTIDASIQSQLDSFAAAIEGWKQREVEAIDD